MSNCAILVAAGSSRRMGFDKLAADLAGKPVLLRTLEAFAAAPSIDHIIIVGPEERCVDLLERAWPKPVVRVDGGAERQDSMANGLAAVPAGTQVVAVHDAARPLIKPEEIDRVIAQALDFGAAVLARPATDTLKRVDAEGFISSSIDRSEVWHMETPQAARFELLERACDAVKREHAVVTDEVSALQHIGVRVAVVAAAYPNLKITSPGDIEIAAALLRSER